MWSGDLRCGLAAALKFWLLKWKRTLLEAGASRCAGVGRLSACHLWTPVVAAVCTAELVTRRGSVGYVAVQPK